MTVIKQDNIWYDVSVDFPDGKNDFIRVYGWHTAAYNEKGEIIAKIYPGGLVKYNDLRAVTDVTAQTVIANVLAEL
jgi:hypothetical protein